LNRIKDRHAGQWSFGLLKCLPNRSIQEDAGLELVFVYIMLTYGPTIQFLSNKYTIFEA